MPRYKVTKYVEAKSLKQALKLEPQAEIDEIGKDELEAKETPNTHAIGFEYKGNDLETDYPDHGV